MKMKENFFASSRALAKCRPSLHLNLFLGALLVFLAGSTISTISLESRVFFGKSKVSARLLASSLSSGVPVPRPTQCLRGV